MEQNYYVNQDLEPKVEFESYLDKEENIICTIKPNKKAYLMSTLIPLAPIALIFLFFDIAFICILAVNVGDEIGVMWAFLIPFMLVHLTPFWILITKTVKSSIELKYREYAITTQKIIIRSGLNGMDFIEYPYDQIIEFKLKSHITDIKFKVADIYVVTSSKVGVLWDVSNPEKVFNDLKQIVEHVKSKKETTSEDVATN